MARLERAFMDHATIIIFKLLMISQQAFKRISAFDWSMLITC